MTARTVTTTALGPIGRLGRLAATHRGVVFATWAVVAVGLGFLAPRVETALSGAGWEATGSESVAVRKQVDAAFGGAGAYGLQVAVHSQRHAVGSPAFQRSLRRVERMLAADPAVSEVVPPAPGVSISPDGHTAVVRATAAEDPNGMVAAADDLKATLAGATAAGVEANLTGAAGMWSDFNEANREAMLKSELFSWPVTLAILVLAFGSLVAAGLPLMLTIAGLVLSAGVLYLGTLLSPISIWAMNFALMFALALGIDYALFVVMRFRSALFGQGLAPADAVATTMDTAGKAVLFSGLTVIVSLAAVMLVPSPAFRSVSLGIMVSVLFVLAATLTLLPAVLAKLGPRVDRLALPWAHSAEHRSPRFARWGELLWRRPLLFGGLALLVLVALALPVLGARTGMPSIKVVPPGDHSRVGYEQLSAAFGPGAPGLMQVTVPQGEARRVAARLQADPGVAVALPPQTGRGGTALIEAMPVASPSSTAFGATLDRLRAELPPAARVGGAAAENHDLEAALAAKTPLVIGVVLGLGFLLLLVAFQAPLIAALGVLTNLLSTAAAFGVAKLDLPGRQPRRPARLRIAGLPRRLGAGLLLRDGLRDRDGLHRLPPLLRPRALGADGQRPRGDGRRPRPLRPRHPRRRRGDGRRLLHLRPLRPAAAKGNGRDPRRRRPPRRLPRPPPASAGGAAPRRPRRLVAAEVARPATSARQLRARRSGGRRGRRARPRRRRWRRPSARAAHPRRSP